MPPTFSEAKASTFSWRAHVCMICVYRHRSTTVCMGVGGSEDDFRDWSSTLPFVHSSHGRLDGPCGHSPVPALLRFCRDSGIIDGTSASGCA